jgi:hypothetical protein
LDVIAPCQVGTMDPVSLTLALAGIPGIFVSCVECYDYIRFGREFTSDFERSFCRLEVAEMRLTRWGAAMGIDSADSQLSASDFPEEEIIQAYHWLKEIKAAFDSAIATSSRYKTTSATKPDKLQTLDPEAEITKRGDPSLQALHQRFSTLRRTRIKPRKRDRIAWALYRKSAFENLIDTISDLTSNLIELFPATRLTQQNLCKDEVKGLDGKALALLDQVIGDQDKLLKPILLQEAASHPNIFTDVEIKGYFHGQFGDNVAPGATGRNAIYTKIVGGGNGTVHFGNNIGFEKLPTLERSMSSQG